MSRCEKSNILCTDLLYQPLQHNPWFTSAFMMHLQQQTGLEILEILEILESTSYIGDITVPPNGLFLTEGPLKNHHFLLLLSHMTAVGVSQGASPLISPAGLRQIYFAFKRRPEQRRQRPTCEPDAFTPHQYLCRPACRRFDRLDRLATRNPMQTKVTAASSRPAASGFIHCRV